MKKKTANPSHFPLSQQKSLAVGLQPPLEAELVYVGVSAQGESTEASQALHGPPRDLVETNSFHTLLPWGDGGVGYPVTS